jgi:hypothetical protein
MRPSIISGRLPLSSRLAGQRFRVTVERGQRDARGQRLFLQRGIERDVSGPLRQGQRNAMRAQDRFQRGRDRSRLVVPLDIASHQRAQVAHRMDPVDPWPALDRVDRPDAP